MFVLTSVVQVVTASIEWGVGLTCCECLAVTPHLEGVSGNPEEDSEGGLDPDEVEVAELPPGSRSCCGWF